MIKLCKEIVYSGEIMFKTVKSKILIFTITTLALLMLVFALYLGIFRMKTKQLMLQNYSLSINTFVRNIDSQIVKMEDNSRDLALIGSLFYQTDRSIPLTESAITKIFNNYPQSLGGGIWFEPYAVDKNKKRFCFYMFRNKNNELVFDNNFSSEEYDYHNQGWYKEITSKITKEHNTAWSLPYYEDQGSYTKMITVGTGIYVGDKLVGISTVDWEISSIFDELSVMKPQEKGFAFYKSGEEIKDSFALFANSNDDYILASNDPYLDNNALVGKSLKNIPWYRDNLYWITYINYHGRKYVPFVKQISNGTTLIICVPKIEMYREIDKFAINMILVLILVGLSVPVLMFTSLKKYVINPIDKLTAIAKKIGKGEDVHIKIDKPEEFAQLAATFDKMTSDIKTATKEKERINSELSIAQSIQLSSLPNKFPAFPECKDFDIFAYMEPAKEVGGDFYDFYFINDESFMFLIADVSGKGVPAALFMMTAKTLINNISQIGYPPKELIKIINNKICENNKQGFFVTMFAAIVNPKTGKASFINCGHNKPLIKHANGNYEYLNLTSNLPLGIYEDVEFEIYETQLKEGDMIVTYTDGVTEAYNEQDNMFGEERLLDTLNNIKDIDNIETILKQLKTDVKQFTQNAVQSDDITALGFRYNKSQQLNNECQYENIASLENFELFKEKIEKSIETLKIDSSLKNKIDMCFEEIFANVVFYAYGDQKGKVRISLLKDATELIMTIEDNGIEYNPLEKPDPDITLSSEERPIGGLGIFMVKAMTKDMTYERKNNTNILKLFFEVTE